MLKKIDVCGQSWTLRGFDESSRMDTAMGRSDEKLGEIAICNQLPESLKDATIIHEWIHSVLSINAVEHSEEVAAVLGNELYRLGFRPHVTTSLPVYPDMVMKDVK